MGNFDFDESENRRFRGSYESFKYTDRSQHGRRFE
jgi:hypothetical protein